MFLCAYERLETSPAISIAEFAQVEICFFFFGLRTMKIGRPIVPIDQLFIFALETKHQKWER